MSADEFPQHRPWTGLEAAVRWTVEYPVLEHEEGLSARAPALRVDGPTKLTVDSELSAADRQDFPPGKVWKGLLPDSLRRFAASKASMIFAARSRT